MIWTSSVQPLEFSVRLHNEWTLTLYQSMMTTVNGVSLTVSETTVHLGHHMSTKDKEYTVNAAKNSFADLLICSYLIMVISTLF